MKNPFTDHPATVGETYFEHMGMAFSFGGKMVLSGMACLLHGIFPWMFLTTGSQAVEQLHTRMCEKRVKECNQAKADAYGTVQAAE